MAVTQGCSLADVRDLEPSRRAAAMARLRLATKTQPGDEAVAAEVRRLGPVEAEHALIRYGTKLVDHDDVMLSLRSRKDIRLTSPDLPAWPRQLDDLAIPPLVLFTRGQQSLRQLAIRSVAIVGSRDLTDYGAQVARQWSADLVALGSSVFSGAAFGIDYSAHAAALDSGGPTVAVLASGVDVPYPVAHRAMLERVVEVGAVVSEVPPGCRPRRHWFLKRNRLIAALTPGTVVIEAGLRSGALSTARAAAALNRVVMAAPGPVNSPASAGCNRLIRDHEAVAVTSARDIREMVSPLTCDDSNGPTELTIPGFGGPSCADRILQLLDQQGDACDLAAMLRAAPDKNVAEVALTLADLEASGRVVRGPQGWRRASRTPG